MTADLHDGWGGLPCLAYAQRVNGDPEVPEVDPSSLNGLGWQNWWFPQSILLVDNDGYDSLDPLGRGPHRKGDRMDRSLRLRSRSPRLRSCELPYLKRYFSLLPILADTARVVSVTASLTATDFRWISRTIRTAEFSKHRVRVGAAVVSKKHFSIEHNKIRNSPAIDWENASVHAEAAALKYAFRGGRGSTIYVVRLGARGALLPSFPCEKCQELIESAKVKRIVWWNGEKWVKSPVGGDYRSPQLT